VRRAAVPLLLALAACGGEAVPESFVVTDSAGVAVAVSSAPAWAEGEAWTIAAEPRVTIGRAEGEAAYLFQFPRGLVRLEDGRIVVADNGSAELRWFDVAGRHLHTAGGRGGGPGEFTFLTQAFTGGDSVFAMDGQYSTLSVFDPEGAFVRTFRLEWPAQFAPPPFARTSDGDWLAAANVGSQEVRTGLVAFRNRMYRYGAEGELLDSLFEFPGGEGYLTVCGPDGSAICNNGPWFARRSARALAAGRVYLGDGAGYDIAVHDPKSGALVGRVRRAVAATPVRAEDVTRQLEATVERYPEERQAEVRRTLGEVPAADSLPAYGALHADPEGNLWVERYGFPWDDARVLDVFDREGRWLGQVSAPVGVTIRGIGRDYVLGMTTDELGVQRVVLYDLVKPAGG
ncbi:MAG: 6-bladed beta-propeller, partial [Gemmatimonadota bacterium]